MFKTRQEALNTDAQIAEQFVYIAETLRSTLDELKQRRIPTTEATLAEAEVLLTRVRNGQKTYLVEEVGIDGFKTDGGEHAWGRDLRYLDGRHGDEVNGLFPVHYAKAYGDLLESAGKAPVTFSRAGFTGSRPPIARVIRMRQCAKFG